MANNMLFTTPIPVQNITRAKVTRVSELDEDNKRMVVELVLTGAAGIIFGPPADPGSPWRLEIKNGSANGIAAPPTPGYMSDSVAQVNLTGAGVATAFDTCLAAYRAAGADKRGNLMVAMQGLSGVVAGGPMDGLTKPMLPPGTLS